MDKNQKAPRWIIKSLLALIIVGVLVLAFVFGGGFFNKVTGHWFTEPNSKTCDTWDGDQLELNLIPGKWTCWVKAPPHATVRIDSDVDGSIKFIDGSGFKMGPDQNNWEGLRKTIFQFTSSEPGTITITVER